jgi:hypothetical protein
MGLKVICFLILGVFACNKVNQWKNPTEVCFNVNVEEELAAEGRLIFNTGYIAIESFSFNGKRTEGADVYFTKQYAANVNAELGESVTAGLTFDIPQGVYTSIDVEVLSQKNNLPNLVLNGTFENNLGAEYSVCFEFSQSETFLIEGETLTGSTSGINLGESLKANATIWLSAGKWFKGVSGATLDRASVISVNGQKTILINENFNTSIYDIVVAELNKNGQKAIFIREV